MDSLQSAQQQRVEAEAAIAKATETLKAIEALEVRTESLAATLEARTCYRTYVFQTKGIEQGCFTDLYQAKRVAALNGARVVERYITFEQLLEFVRKGEVDENPFIDYSGY